MELDSLWLTRLQQFIFKNIVCKLGAVFEGESMPLIIPAGMIAGFSCELYLKSMLLANGCSSYGCSPYGCNLMELFGKLPYDEQQLIIELLIEKGYTKEDILLELDNLSEAFIEIRYSHERTGFAFNTIFCLRFLRFYIDAVKK